MRIPTATQASRGFSELLDRVERGETIFAARAGRVVAELRPAAPTSGRALRTALAGAPGMDDAFEADIIAATGLPTTDESDPWRAG